MDISRIFELYEVIKKGIPEKYPRPKLLVFSNENELLTNQIKTNKKSRYGFFGIYDPNSDSIGIPLETVSKLTDADVIKIILHEICHAHRAKKFGTSSSKYFDERACNLFASRWSKKVGIKIENDLFGGWTKEEEEYLIKEYQHNTIEYLTTKFGKSWSSIKNKAWKLNLKNRARTKYSINHSFFSPPFTPEAMWVAGFIAADGCIRTNKKCNSNGIKIDISAIDIEVLEKIKSLIGFSGPIQKYKRYGKEYACLEFSSESMKNDLNTYFGVTSKKSLTYMIPDDLKEHYLLSHFLRGYMDGDGSYYYEYQYVLPYLRVSATGTKAFMTFMCSIFVAKCGAKAVPKFSKTGKAYSFKYGGNKLCPRIIEYLYKDCDDLYLKRKYDIVFNSKLIEAINSSHQGVLITDAAGQETIYDSVEEAAIATKIPKGTIRWYLHSHPYGKGYTWQYINRNGNKFKQNENKNII